MQCKTHRYICYGMVWYGMCHSSVWFLIIMQHFLSMQKMQIVDQDVVSHIMHAETWEQEQPADKLAQLRLHRTTKFLSHLSQISTKHIRHTYGNNRNAFTIIKLAFAFWHLILLCVTFEAVEVDVGKLVCFCFLFMSQLMHRTALPPCGMVVTELEHTVNLNWA